jgi:hypothetical protein
MGQVIHNLDSAVKNYVVSGIRHDYIAEFWPRVSDMIRVAVAHSNDELDTDIIYERILRNEMFLLVISDEQGNIDAATVVEPRVFETGKRVLNVTTTGGENMSDWLTQLVEACKGIAKDFDCEEVYVVGRPGWLKTLKRFGFKPRHQIVSLEV